VRGKKKEKGRGGEEGGIVTYNCSSLSRLVTGITLFGLLQECRGGEKGERERRGEKREDEKNHNTNG